MKTIMVTVLLVATGSLFASNYVEKMTGRGSGAQRELVCVSSQSDSRVEDDTLAGCDTLASCAKSFDVHKIFYGYEAVCKEAEIEPCCQESYPHEYVSANDKLVSAYCKNELLKLKIPKKSEPKHDDEKAIEKGYKKGFFNKK